ncbi:GNAT family N-acetyltransferase [Candidatus Thorarchaeota archaeon]|nr:MAG: GNAT family N-acetyltransferase [Candidatus Thorarchaeota archaeon]
MPQTLRALDMDDHPQVEVLSEGVWSGNDYVPDRFPIWVKDQNVSVFGILEGDELIAICALELVPGTTIAWAEGLRVKEGHREKGLAKKLVQHIKGIADEHGVRTLWYATSSRNEPSMAVAERVGFRLADSVGYFRLYRPFPDHPKPSLSYIPLEVDSDRLYDILLNNPELVESTTIPMAWEFDFRSKEGLERLSEKTQFKVVFDGNGDALSLYCRVDRKRKEELTSAFTLFARDRSIFIDVLSRMIDEAASANADRAVFFLGPRATEWALASGYVTEEFVDRKFLLYEYNPAAESGA